MSIPQTFIVARKLILHRFRWVVCQIDYLCECAHDEERREALTKLPPTLTGSYRRLLERVNSCSPKVQAIVQLCLQFIAFAEPKLSIPQLRQAVSVSEVLGAHLDASNTITEHEISRRCSSLIRKSECGNYFEFAHFSVQEFLKDEVALSTTLGPNLSQYLISRPRSNALLATQCLRFLQLKNFNSFVWRDRDRKYPFYQYSAREWLRLTRDGLDAVTLNPAKSLFHPSKTKCFLIWVEELKDYVFDTNRRFADTLFSDDNFRPLHLAAVLNIYELCDFLLEDSTNVNARCRAGRPIDLAVTASFQPSKARSASNLVTLLPCTERRNLTINCLINKGARLSDNLRLSGHNSAFTIACDMVGKFDGDFTPIVAILSLGVIPGHTEITAFKNQIFRHNSINAESTTHKLLQYLSSSSSYKTEWGFQIGTIVWEWALRQNLAYTGDPFLVDSRISLSEKALITTAEVATRFDNVDVLSKCLDDDRVDFSTSRLDGGRTLLHIAVKHASVNSIGILLDAGCKSDALDVWGYAPIHWCLGNHRCVIESFLKKGVSLLSLDPEGCTIWHYWAKGAGHHTFLKDTFELDPDATSKALLMKTAAGFTPLSLSLPAAFNAEARAVEIIEFCNRIPEFWQNHVPIFGAAVKHGRERVIRCLKETNAKLDRVSPNRCTPLHQLSAMVSLDCVHLLLSSFPDVRLWRFAGRLPVELYIKKSLGISREPDHQIVKALLPLDILQNEYRERKVLWEYVQGLQVEELQRPAVGKSLYGMEQSHIPIIHKVLATYMRLGLHEDYENEHNESVIIKLISSLSLNGHIDRLSCSVSEDVLHQWIGSTRLWAAARNSYVILRFLKAAIRDLNLNTVVLLIDNGVDIHRRIEGVSAIEYACQIFIENNTFVEYYWSGCSESHTIVSKLLNESSREKLINLMLSEDLHKLATSHNVRRFSWLIAQFIRRGVDVSAQTSNREAHRVLMYHINRNGGCAELLLSAGLDPTIASSTHGSLNAIQFATLTGDIDFLKSVFTHTTAKTLVIDWAKTFNCSIEIDGESISLKGVNALHIAALAGRVECLEFFLDQVASELPPKEINTASSVGRYTPLHLAACYNRVDVISLLLSKGATLTQGDEYGRTPLHNAVKEGHLAATKLLLEYGSPEIFDNFGRKPKAYVSGPDHDYILSCLDEASRAGEINVQMVPTLKVHALSEALELAISGDDLHECISILAFGCPIDVRMPSCLGCSPLIMAMGAEEPKVRIIEWLLEKGANVLNPACQYHEMLSPLEIAVQKPQLNSLLPKFFDAYHTQGGDLISGDDYPLHVAVSWQNNEGLEILLEEIERRIDSIG